MIDKDVSEPNPKIDPAPNSNTEKQPDDWVSGNDPMTGAQASYLKTLSEECDEPESFQADLRRRKHRNASTRSRQSDPRCVTVSAMSRAFVKETDARTEELPDRQISSHRNFVTETGLAAIEAAIGQFEVAYHAATDKGDAQAAAAALREVRYWRTRRASAEVVRPSSDTRTASFGMTVALRREDGREQTFRIVGEDEADPSRERCHTSRPSPVPS